MIFEEQVRSRTEEWCVASEEQRAFSGWLARYQKRLLGRIQ